MSTLFINLTRSECGACGANVLELKAESCPGCKTTWTHVSSHYSNFEQLHEGIQRIRPDLIFIDPGASPDKELQNGDE